MATATRAPRARVVGWLRQQDAADYLGISVRQLQLYQARGWITPDARLPRVHRTPRDPRALPATFPVYRASSLDAAIARLNDPTARLLSAEKISQAKRRPRA